MLCTQVVKHTPPPPRFSSFLQVSPLHPITTTRILISGYLSTLSSFVFLRSSAFVPGFFGSDRKLRVTSHQGTKYSVYSVSIPSKKGNSASPQCSRFRGTGIPTFKSRERKRKKKTSIKCVFRPELAPIFAPSSIEQFASFFPPAC